MRALSQPNNDAERSLLDPMAPRGLGDNAGSGQAETAQLPPAFTVMREVVTYAAAFIIIAAACGTSLAFSSNDDVRGGCFIAGLLLAAVVLGCCSRRKLTQVFGELVAVPIALASAVTLADDDLIWTLKIPLMACSFLANLALYLDKVPRLLVSMGELRSERQCSSEMIACPSVHGLLRFTIVVAGLVASSLVNVAAVKGMGDIIAMTASLDTLKNLFFVISFVGINQLANMAFALKNAINFIDTIGIRIKEWYDKKNKCATVIISMVAVWIALVSQGGLTLKLLPDLSLLSKDLLEPSWAISLGVITYIGRLAASLDSSEGCADKIGRWYKGELQLQDRTRPTCHPGRDPGSLVLFSVLFLAAVGNAGGQALFTKPLPGVLGDAFPLECVQVCQAIQSFIIIFDSVLGLTLKAVGTNDTNSTNATSEVDDPELAGVPTPPSGIQKSPPSPSPTTVIANLAVLEEGLTAEHVEGYQGNHPSPNF